MNGRIVIPIALVVVLALGVLYMSFQSVTQEYIEPEESFFYESDEAFGTSLLASILEEVYGEDHIVPMSEVGSLSLSSKDENKGYFIIGDYVSYDLTELDSLRAFVEAGNHAMFILSSADLALDTTVLHSLLWEETGQDSIIDLTVTSDDREYQLTCHYEYLDSIEYRFYSGIHMTHEDSLGLQVHSRQQEDKVVSISYPYGEGSVYLHSIPYAFSNISLKQEDMIDYVVKVLPLLDIDTLYLDHTYYMDWSDPRDQNALQYIMSQPGLKAAYYLTLATLLLFLISRAKRRQKVVPVILHDENTSLEYVQTVSQLYRSHNKHYKLVTHIETIFNEWVNKKYYLKRDHTKFVDVLAQKSKIEKEKIEKILQQINAAKGNTRFDEYRLINLHKDLHHFYKNCK